MNPTVPRRPLLLGSLSLLGSALACEAGRVPPDSDDTPTPQPELPPSPRSSTRAVRKLPTALAGMNWGNQIEWLDFEAGQAQARKLHRSMFVMVYANWCSKCKALMPLFSEDQFVALAKNLVMVRQDADLEPAWLQRYNREFGSYVPRIFFFKADGTLNTDITSGHSRYPYFYTSGQADLLKQHMRRASVG